MRAKHWLGVLVVAFVSLQSAFAAAQVNRATISGTVPDPSTAAMPGVTITITGASGVVQTAVTNEAGQYTVPSLPWARTP
jgi:hypothetical protein